MCLCVPAVLPHRQHCITSIVSTERIELTCLVGLREKSAFFWRGPFRLPSHARDPRTLCTFTRAREACAPLFLPRSCLADSVDRLDAGGTDQPPVCASRSG